jgi:shikimate kinase
MIVLVGFMGAGKTSTGRALAARLGVPFLDSDEVIEARSRRRIADIFAEDGEPAFRALEAATIAELVEGPRVVLALGGGAAESAGTRAALRGATVVHLSVGYPQALARVGGDPGRPMLARPDIADVYARRLPLYAEVADIEVLTDDRTVAEVVRLILAALDAPATD